MCRAWQERNLLSVAYKNVVGARRASLRIIGSIQNKEEQKGDSEKVNLISAYKGKAPSPPPSPPLWQAVCASLVAAQAAMQNLATSMFNTVALEPTYDAQPGPNVPLQGGSATGVMQPMKRTTILFHTLFKVACLPADAGRANPTARCSPAGPTHAAGFGPPHVRLRVVDLR